MRLVLALLASIALSVSTLAAHADTVSFAIDAPLSMGGVLQATYTYNSSNIYASTLVGSVSGTTMHAGGINSSVIGEVLNGSGPFGLIFHGPGGIDEVDLTFQNAAFENGQAICLPSSNCAETAQITNFSDTYSDQFLDTTTASPIAPAAAVTPEPSSIALLATGLFGVAGMVRKRLS